MNIGFNPKVSIVIPVYNGGDFLAEAIDSALDQTYHNIEVLVVNDGSIDDGKTERIVLSYGDRVRYYRKPNGGVASALNLAIDNMSGEFFSWLSHDDLYVKDKVERQMDVLASVSAVDHDRTIVYSDFCAFTTDSDKGWPVQMRGVPPEEFRYWLTTENTLHGCTLLIPKAAFVEVGGFDERLRTTQDYDLWFRMAKCFRFVHLPEVLVKARSHPEQGSIKMSELATRECNTLLSGFVEDLSSDELFRSSKKTPALAYAEIAASLWYRGFFSAGWRASHLSCKNFANSSFWANIVAAGVITKGISMYTIIKFIRKLVPPTFRLAIRNRIKSKNKDVIPRTDSIKNIGLKEKFSTVYEENIFGGSVSRSGEGSNLIQTDVIRREIPKLLQEFGIRTFLDAPCGDWYWMKEVDLPVERYIGLDIVDALVAKNQRDFGSAKVSFECINLADGNLPKADLIFSRDCLVHLSFSDALKIVANFKRSGAKYLLTTTFTNREINLDLADGFWRPLNKEIAPFNFPKPIRLINEGCTEENNLFTDKCLGLWMLQDINLPESN